MRFAVGNEWRGIGLRVAEANIRDAPFWHLGSLNNALFIMTVIESISSDGDSRLWRESAAEKRLDNRLCANSSNCD
jgi:hypothetical protein